MGVATLYNYYQTKAKLVIAISGKIWGDLWKEILEEKGSEIFESFTAYQYIEFYTDQIIRIYRERPEILRFSNNYKTLTSALALATLSFSITRPLSHASLATVLLLMMRDTFKYLSSLIFFLSIAPCRALSSWRNPFAPII